MDFQQFWIDGSIYKGDSGRSYFFFRILGLSIINEAGDVILQWGTRELRANSFKAELLALWMVLQFHPGPLRGLLVNCACMETSADSTRQ